MRLKRNIRRILHAILAALMAVGVGFLVGLANSEQEDQLCHGYSVSISYPSTDTLLTVREIDSVLFSVSGRLKGMPLWKINTARLEGAVEAHPYVAGAEVYASADGRLYIDLIQHQPLIRVITQDNNSLYISEDGTLLSVDKSYPVRVLVASGNIPEEGLILMPGEKTPRTLGRAAEDPLLSDLYELAGYIRRDTFFSHQIEQVYVNASGEFELIPKVGNHVVLFGPITGMQEKFNRLWAFYLHGLNQIGWNKYTLINIKYANQVVCSRL